MIEFRQKDFSLKEGHYTGPKDMDKVPGALEVVGKSALGAGLAGSAIGAILEDSTAWKGFKQGVKVGGIGGIFLKIFINYLHKPMSRVKFQEIDRNIRREFGIYRAAGITIGDKLSNRASVDEKFSFSDRQVTLYKVNFAVQDGRITMYTFDLTNQELDKVDKVLDYYCKKYTGMEYTSSVINYKLNSYAVDIIFTNYQVISNFIMELSNELRCKINLLDNKAIVEPRLKEAGEAGGIGDEEEIRNFSVATLGKYDAIKILGKAGRSAIVNYSRARNIGGSISSFIMTLLTGVAEKISGDELVKSGHPAPREYFNNTYLEEVLKKNKYIEGFHYTVDHDSKAPIQISIASGLLVVTSNKGEVSEEIDKVLKPWLLKMGRKDLGKAVLWTYSIQSKKELDLIVQKLMKSQQGNINIFDK